MYNDVNIGDRLRKSVRGRVIVFTNSRVIEFLDEDLTQSIPLYSTDQIPERSGVVFSVELDGFLTFDGDAYVKIVELSPYVAPYFNPAAFAIVEVGDFYQPVIAGAYVDAPTTIGGDIMRRGLVQVDFLPNYGKRVNYFFKLPTPLQRSAALSYVEGIFPAGADFRGINAYSPLVLSTNAAISF